MKNRKEFKCDAIMIFEESVNAMNDTYKGVPSVNKPRLTQLKTHMQSRYDEYGVLFTENTLDRISQSTCSDDESASLVYLYDSNNSKIKKLKDNIRKEQELHLQFICPYCGILPATTMDHYIPKEEHPDFSILASNLIWSCSNCNGKKSTYWREETGRGVVNFYTDKLPKFRFINCTITSDNGVLAAKWDLFHEKLIDYPIIDKHFRRLGIIKLLNDHAPTKLGELIADISAYKHVITPQQVREILLNRYFGRIKDFGKNDWNASLLRSFILGEYYLPYI